MTKQRISAADAIIRCMEIEGITQAFCVPGESYLPIMNAMYEHPTIQLMATRHESGAAFMAEGYAKATGKPAVVMATRGVGAANLSIGVHTAFQDSTPMVVFLGQVHSKFRGREGFQEVDLDRFFEPISKWAIEIRDADRIPELVQRAFRVAVSGRPGPVVIAFPEDVLAADIDASFSSPVNLSKPIPNTSDILDIIKLLEQAKRPLIVAGGGVKSSNAEEVLKQFSENFSIPVLASFRRHDVFPNNHPNYVGHSGLGPANAILETMRTADVLVVVGSRLSEVTTQDYSIFSDDQKIVHIDIDPSMIGKVYAPVIGVVADAKMALQSLNESGAGILDANQYLEWTNDRRLAYEAAANLDGQEFPDHPQGCNMKAIIKTLINTLPNDTVITNDAGNFAGWLHAFYPFTKTKTYIGPTSGAMGYGFPAALGAKIANPKKTVVSLSGDGGFMMTMQELETAVRHNISVIALVFNNAMYGTIRMHQEKSFPERVIATDLNYINFAELARVLGADSYRVDSSQQFKKVISEVINNPLDGPVVIEVKVDPEFISVKSTIASLRNNAVHSQK